MLRKTIQEIIKGLFIGTLFSLIGISLFLELKFNSDSINYEDKDKLLSLVKPELKEGINRFIFTNKEINSFYGQKSYLLGYYTPVFDIIKIVVNETMLEEHYLTTKKLLCHELGHHYFTKKMAEERKEFWFKKYYIEMYSYNPEQIFDFIILYPNPNEYFAEYMEENEELCYIDQKVSLSLYD